MNDAHFTKHQNEIESGLSEEDEMYKENILEHYKHPHNKGKIQHNHERKELNPTCGDEIDLYLEVKDGKIQGISFEGQGCAISQASVSMLTDKVKGMSTADAKNLTKDDVYRMLGIPISVARIRCALLSLKTLHGALKSHEA